MHITQQLDFLRNWITDPLRVGAVAPSSDSLAELITREITVADAPVIELGPGTGVFTRSLLDRGIPQNRLALIESGREFAAALAWQFPAAHVLCMDASNISQVRLFSGQYAGAVISGLPLFSMPNRKVAEVLRCSFDHLRKAGCFYQFTYAPRCPVSPDVLQTCGLRADRVGGTLFNVPPAAVYKISRVTETRRAAPVCR